jgi:hypothetical protein
MPKFIRISNYLPPLPCKIFSYGSIGDNGKMLNFFLARPEKGGADIFRVAVNPLLCPQNPDFYSGVLLDKLIKKAAINPEEPPYLMLDMDFPYIKGTVTTARTFWFGNVILSELEIEKERNQQLVHIVFFPHRRLRKQWLSLAGNEVLISPEKLLVKIGKRMKEWDGKQIRKEK